MKIIIGALRVLTWVCAFIGCLFVLGSVGALEHDTITFTRFFVQELGAFGLLGVAYLSYYVRGLLLEIEFDKHLNSKY